MSDDNIENLPSINDFLEEENSEELPSIEEYVEKEEEVIEEEKIEEPVLETTAGDLTEVLRLISDVRRDIPNIPEIKCYDEELRLLSEELIELRKSIPEVPEIPEQKSYDGEVEAICEQIDLVREEIRKLPEPKYYDEQVTVIEDRLDSLQTDVTNLPEVKYYDSEIAAICEQIDQVKSDIPRLPDWVNEDSLPDLSWVGRTFSILDENVTKVDDALHTVKDRLKCEVEQITESISTKQFETGVEIEGVRKNIEETKEEIRDNIKEVTDKIYDELKEAALQITGHHREFKDDDRKLRKQILGEYNVLKQNVNEKIKEFNEKNIESQNVITGSLRDYFDQLQKEITELPEVKYYDKDVEGLRKDLSSLDEKYGETSTNIRELYRIIEDLQESQNFLKEDLTDSPPTYTDLGVSKDPLAPLDQKFATLKDLSEHYRLFVNRIQTQMASIGGGGAVNLQYLDDITGIATNLDAYDGMYLQVAIAQTGYPLHKKFKFSTVNTAGAAGTWASDSVGVSTTKNVGIATTARSDYSLYVEGDGFFTGSVTGLGTIHFNDVTHVDSTGISTFQDGINVTAGGIGIGTTNRRHALVVGNPGAAGTSVLIHGDTRIVGVLTVGSGSVTIDGVNNKINIGDEDVLITNSSITIGDNVSIAATATGINSAPNVYYVAKDGADTNNGTSIDNAFLTISAAVGAASSGTTVKVLSGNYAEDNPIEVPAYVSVVGDDQRTVIVSPDTPTKDIFHVR